MELILLAGVGTAALLMLELYDLMRAGGSHQLPGPSHETAATALLGNCTDRTQTLPLITGIGGTEARRWSAADDARIEHEVHCHGASVETERARRRFERRRTSTGSWIPLRSL